LLCCLAVVCFAFRFLVLCCCFLWLLMPHSLPKLSNLQCTCVLAFGVGNSSHSWEKSRPTQNLI
jgi:hypothetical protein